MASTAPNFGMNENNFSSWQSSFFNLPMMLTAVSNLILP